MGELNGFDSADGKIRLYHLKSPRTETKQIYVMTLCQMEKVYTSDVRLMQPHKTITWHGPVRFGVSTDGPINTSY